MEQGQSIKLSFNENNDNGGEEKCNVSVHPLIAQMLVRDGMSTAWCMSCKGHSKDWKGLIPVPAVELWSVAQQLQYVKNIDLGLLKEARGKKGIATFPTIFFLNCTFK